VGTHLLNDGAKVIIAQNESIPEKGKTGKEQK